MPSFLLALSVLALGAGRGFCGEPTWPGTGLIIDPVGFEVKAVIEGSPAEKAAVQAGDKVLAINGIATKGMSWFEFGKYWDLAGSKIALDIARPGAKKREVSLTREDIPQIKFLAPHRRLAQENLALSQHSLAIHYRMGIGVKKDAKKFIEWTLKAAKQGYAPAQYDMGYAHASGFGVALDPKESFKWYRKAAEQGLPAAQHSIADAYWFGLGTAKDMAEGIRWYEKAAAAGVAGAQGQLGWIYQNGGGVAKDMAKAIEWYQKAAEQGHVVSQFNLANLYYSGKDVPVDFTQAMIWYRKAADQGNASAQEMMGFGFMAGNGVKQDYAEAARWFRLASEQGLLASMSNLGWIYQNGLGVAKDMDKALEWYRKAADKGHLNSQMNLASIYYTGQGVPVDFAQAVDWYRRAAAQGSPGAQEMLGFASLAGNGVKQDYAEAARWLRLSSEQGLPASMSNLGWLYSLGHGVERDDQEALKWLKKAADAGDPYAMHNLGWIYETGRGVAADDNEARKWYEKAIEKGGNKTAAKSNLDNLIARKTAKASSPAAAPAAPAASREQLEDIVKTMLRAQKEEEAKIQSAAAKNISSDVDEPLYKSTENPDNVAIVVGIENYAGLPAARFAARDAQAVRAHLGALGYAPRNIALLTEQQATRAGLSKTINTWLPSRVNANSTVFFYYSGHGAPDVKSGQAFLVPADGDPEYLEDTAYPIKQLYDKLGALKAKRVIVALDSCFSGAGGRSVLAKDVRPLVTRLEGMSLAPGKVVSLSASKADQISGGLEDQGHGTFTYYLLKGLNGAAAKSEEVTVRSLYEYLKPKVEDAARLKSRDQTPQLSPAGGDAKLR